MSLLLMRKNEIIINTSSPTLVGFFVCGHFGLAVRTKPALTLIINI